MWVKEDILMKRLKGRKETNITESRVHLNTNKYCR